LIKEQGTDLGETIESVISGWVKEYRQELGMTVSELAKRSGISKGMLSKIENVQVSPSLTTLGKIASAMAVPVTAFFRGLEEEEEAFHVKAGEGLEIAHRGTRAGHRYRLLGAARRNPRAPLEPVLVSFVEETEVFPLYQHDGTEFIYMLQGVMEYSYGSSRFVLTPGDCLQFEAHIPHGPIRMRQLPVEFLSIKAQNVGANGARRRQTQQPH